MAKNDKPNGPSGSVKALDLVAKKLLSTIDPNYVEKEILNNTDSKIQSIISDELHIEKGVSKGSIVDFAVTMAQNAGVATGKDKEMDAYNLFTEDIGNLFGYFQDLHRNRYLELSDLRFINKFIPSIGEAVQTTLDAIISADDFSGPVARNISFGKDLTEEDTTAIEAEIDRIEKNEKILVKLKNTVFPKTLVGGSHYVYCIPYDELFSEYDKLVKSGRVISDTVVSAKIAQTKMDGNKNVKNVGINLQKTFESYGYEEDLPFVYGIDDISYAIESTIEEYNEENSRSRFTMSEKKEVEKMFTSALENVHFVDSPVLAEAYEGYTSADHMREMMQGYQSMFGGSGVVDEKQINAMADGTYDGGGSRPESFKVTGSYTKYIDATRAVPIRAYNQTIGYLHVHDMSASKKAKNIENMSNTNILGSTSNMFSSSTLAQDKKNKAVQSIIDMITDGILKNFSNKFVNKNVEFKKMIADCIISNGFVNNSFQIQFIPAKYIIPFTVNEDDEGIGHSVIENALFPAKMLLQFLVSKLLLFMNNAGDKTLAYIRKGPIDVSSGNHVQRVLRMLQESQITFSDLLSTNLAFAKFNRNGAIQLPMAKNGDRLIDFEVQNGQDIEMNTAMEEYLEKQAIMGTPVPSVILEYTNAADYAKSIVTANIKFAGRVSSLQADLEEPMTEYYKALLASSNLDDSLKKKACSSISVKLCRPRVLANNNMSDYLGNLTSLIESIGNLLLGQNDQDEKATKIRTAVGRKWAYRLLPFISWDVYEDDIKSAMIEVESGIDLDSGSSGDAESDSGSDEYM